jgi:small conductance mechanosensitive channel
MPQDLTAVQNIYRTLESYLVAYSFQVIGALLILAAGFLVARWTGNAILRVQERRNVDVTLRLFIASAARLTVITLFVVVALSQLGISITPLIAAIGGLAVGASFALQGPVSNYGAGLVIILTRMFKVGDTITVQGCSGVVEDISLAATRLRAEDGEVVVIPNKHVVGEIHRNSYAMHIVEGTVRVGYASDPLEAAALVRAVLAETEGVGAQPSAQVGIDAFETLAIVIGYRYWAPTLRLFDVKHAVNAAVYRRLTSNGIVLSPPRELIIRS